MENVGKLMEDHEHRKVLQTIGIGTPATRAAIIETLFRRHYIQREKKALIPTEKGIQVYEMVKDKKIADVTMTAEWELTLKKIENKEIDPLLFQHEIEDYTSTIVCELSEISIANDDMPVLICPKCKRSHLIIRDKIAKCSDSLCNWVHFRNVCGVLISIDDLKSLVVKGRTSLIKGMKSKVGKTFDATIVLKDDHTTSFEFVNTKGSFHNKGEK